MISQARPLVTMLVLDDASRKQETARWLVLFPVRQQCLVFQIFSERSPEYGGKWC